VWYGCWRHELLASSLDVVPIAMHCIACGAANGPFTMNLPLPPGSPCSRHPQKNHLALWTIPNCLGFLSASERPIPSVQLNDDKKKCPNKAESRIPYVCGMQSPATWRIAPNLSEFLATMFNQAACRAIGHVGCTRTGVLDGETRICEEPS
jgi:hypothetical protein